uniref:Plastid light harvesting protein n=1 Tax=Odontella aurita TaxID=265563 RepID=A0A7S4JV13_9STRA|mmetsp:Transcript_54665/g.163356  ORF Transcript_54665/g.163356 Transcript_54665/m.163356 type:complete len:269 (+) Transcript_54665:503-1309(+)
MFKVSAAVVLALCGSTKAFAPSSQVSRCPALNMADSADDTTPTVLDEEAMPVIEVPVPVAPPPLPTMSQSMPFMERPAALTGAIAGDVGFDPLGFAKSESDLMNYREAEVKHARLAMLAAAGWPLSEVFDRKIATALNLAPAVDANDRAPSLLNGGLGKVSPLYWVACLGLAAAVDFYGIQKSKENNPDYFPGNLGFDPFGVYPKDKDGQERMQLAEIKNGRLAMIAIFAFAVQEAVSKVGVVDETPLFFFPIAKTLHDYTNSGYIMH